MTALLFAFLFSQNIHAWQPVWPSKVPDLAQISSLLFQSTRLTMQGNLLNSIIVESSATRYVFRNAKSGQDTIFQFSSYPKMNGFQQTLVISTPLRNVGIQIACHGDVDPYSFEDILLFQLSLPQCKACTCQYKFSNIGEIIFKKNLSETALTIRASNIDLLIQYSETVNADRALRLYQVADFSPITASVFRTSNGQSEIYSIDAKEITYSHFASRLENEFFYYLNFISSDLSTIITPNASVGLAASKY